MDTIRSQFLEAQEVLTSFISDDANILAIENAGALIVNSFRQKGKLMSCGNGGSMCDAMHFVEELSGPLSFPFKNSAFMFFKFNPCLL